MREKRTVSQLRGEVVMWLFEEAQASFEEIAAVLHCTRVRARQIYEREQARRDPATSPEARQTARSDADV